MKMECHQWSCFPVPFCSKESLVSEWSVSSDLECDVAEYFLPSGRTDHAGFKSYHNFEVLWVGVLRWQWCMSNPASPESSWEWASPPMGPGASQWRYCFGCLYIGPGWKPRSHCLHRDPGSRQSCESCLGGVDFLFWILENASYIV